MNKHFCHICGTAFDGESCPACGAALELSEELSAASETATPVTDHSNIPTPPLQSNLPTYVRKARFFLWIMLVSMLILSVIFVWRNPTCLDDFLLNIEQFIEIRKNLVYFWEAEEVSAQLPAPAAFVKNIPQFLKLVGDNFFNALEEVSAIWSIH